MCYAVYVSIVKNPIPQDLLDDPAFAASFWARVKGRPGECWPWRGSRGRTSGYFQITVAGSEQRVHRLAHALATGSDPGMLNVLHACDNPPCCNPAHLRAGTQAENAADRTARGRGYVGPKGANSTAGSRVVPFRLSAEDADSLTELARRQGESVSALLRRMIRDLLTDQNPEPSP